MKISIRKRNSGRQPGGRGGWIRGGLKEVEKRSTIPDTDWETYLAETHGFGPYVVFGFAGNSKIEVLFKGEVGWL